MFLRSITILLLLAAFTASSVFAQSQSRVALKPNATQREVSFTTEDGWAIHGTLTVPASHQPGEKLPAALLLHSSMHTQMVWAVYPGWVRAQEAIITLRIDWRGRGRSRGARRFVEFSPAQREQVALDVRAALDFLAAQKEVDSSHLAVVAEEFSAQPAVIGAMADPRVRAFVLFSGWLNQQALDLIAANPTKAMLLVVSKEDKRSLAEMMKAHALMAQGESELWLQDGLGVGAAMGSVWRNRHPDQPEEQAIDFAAAAWLVNRLRSYGRFSEITLQTADGWILHATLGMPDGASADKPAAGVILLPTALSDRTSYYSLERVLARHGIATLNLDWRGTGDSTNKGALISLSLAEMQQAITDVHEAFKYLKSVAGVDPERTGILGSAFGAKLAMNAARANPKLKAVALLTPVTKPTELQSDSEAVTAINCPVLLITGDGFGEATKKIAALVSQNSRHTVKTYPGGILGYELFTVDAGLESGIARWFRQQLDPSDRNHF